MIQNHSKVIDILPETKEPELRERERWKGGAGERETDRMWDSFQDSK